MEDVMKHDNDNRTVAASSNAADIRFLSVCSGIEAASVAWHPIGWRAVAYSEIEKFPSAVLAHHYPDVPNLGDFTKIDTTTLGRVDILAGGTPCQAFSIAGLRQSLADARGNLSLEFVRLAHELADRNGLRNVVWENVVGVLSTKDNAFGCFLAGLVGADDAVIPSEKPVAGKSTKHWKWRKGGRYPVLDDDGEETGEYITREPWHALTWPGAGMVSGPKGRAAWRVLDAQYFGVAQRRRRVIVVADFGNGADPAAVLFEQDSLRRYSPPSRETGKDVAGAVAGGAGSGGRGVARTGDTRGQDPVVAVLRGHSDYGPGAPTLRAKGGDCAGGSEALVFAPEIARCDATREGTSQDYETTTMVAVGIHGDIAHTLKAEGADASEDGTGRGTPIVCIHADAIGRTGDAKTPSLDATGVSRIRDPGIGIARDGTSYNLMASGQAHAVTYSIMPQNSGKDFKAREVDVAQPLMAGGPVGGNQGGGYVLTSAVRRLTPMECERLQGFPDGYTAIPWRGKPADQCPDGPRYKALGNSWAVPKFVWLGKRLHGLLAANDNTPAKEAA